MAKAELILFDGTKVIIDGSPEEITKVLGSLGSAQPPSKRAASSRPAAKRTARQNPAPEGPTAFILDLKKEGFFKERRSFNEIRKALEERGHIYPRTSISPVVIKLVRRKDLRRIKEGKRWAYVS